MTPEIKKAIGAFGEARAQLALDVSKGRPYPVHAREFEAEQARAALEAAIAEEIKRRDDAISEHIPACLGLRRELHDKIAELEAMVRDAHAQVEYMQHDGPEVVLCTCDVCRKEG